MSLLSSLWAALETDTDQALSFSPITVPWVLKLLSGAWSYVRTEERHKDSWSHTFTFTTPFSTGCQQQDMARTTSMWCHTDILATLQS